MGLIIAGNDTSGLGVTALLAVLPMFPAVLDKLRQEQQQLIGQFGPELTINVLDQMHYAEAVVKEVLRVAPPSGLVMRKTLVDMEVKLGVFRFGGGGGAWRPRQKGVPCVLEEG